MADFESPEVRVREKRSSPVAFPAVSPGVGAYIGIAKRGPINKPVLVFGVEDADEVFGGFIDSYLPDALKHFFDNGGERCYVNRVAHYTDINDANTLTAVAASSTLQSGGTDALKITASSEGAWANSYRITTVRVDTVVAKVAATGAGNRTRVTLSSVLRVAVGDTLNISGVRGVVASINSTNRSVEFEEEITVPLSGWNGTENVVNETLAIQVIDENGVVAQTFRNLRMSPLAGRTYVENVINNTPRSLIYVENLGIPVSSGDPRPANVTSQLLGTTVEGSDGDEVQDTDYVGSATSETGLYAFDTKDDFFMISIPGQASEIVHAGLETYVENRQDIFCITETPQGLQPLDAVTYVTNTANIASSYMAIYYPWIRAVDPRTGGPKSYPPSGFVQGVFARTFKTRNFGKAPAGDVDGRILGALGVDYEVQKRHYDVLYPNKINAIQKLRGKGICVMGSRTLDPMNGDFLQIPVRVVFLMVKRVFLEGTRWALFETNNNETRSRVVRFMKSYLSGLRRAGVLEGETDEEAFFIQCDEKNNTPSVRRRGKLVCRVGLNVGDTIEFVDITLERDTRALDAELATEVG